MKSVKEKCTRPYSVAIRGVYATISRNVTDRILYQNGTHIITSIHSMIYNPVYNKIHQR
jgi:hypothetical protein